MGREKINCIGIIGLGLIGGSLAKSFKKNSVCAEIVAYDRDRVSLNQALTDKVVDRIADGIDESFGGCDLVFVCVPVNGICDMLIQLNNFVDKDCILTDVGSTKTNIMKTLKDADFQCTYIGGHPMAGSEKDGYKASRDFLFENAYYVLVPEQSVQPQKLNLLTEVVKATGALPVIMEYQKHDDATAAISHVPHVIASALVNMVQEVNEPNGYMQMLAAGGFKDITRIAASSPKVWESICIANKDRILDVLTTYERHLADFKKALTQSDSASLEEFFKKSRDYRNTFSDRAMGPILKTYDILVNVVDEPGIIASIAGLLSINNLNIKNIGIINNRELDEGILDISFYDEESLRVSLEILTNNGYQAFAR